MEPREILTNSEKKFTHTFHQTPLVHRRETNSNTPYQSPRRKKTGERGEEAAPGLLAADTFSPGWYLEPGLKVSNEPGLIETMNLAALKRPLALV
jgi:hypothetical protein